MSSTSHFKRPTLNSKKKWVLITLLCLSVTTSLIKINAAKQLDLTLKQELTRTHIKLAQYKTKLQTELQLFDTLTKIPGIKFIKNTNHHIKITFEDFDTTLLQCLKQLQKFKGPIQELNIDIIAKTIDFYLPNKKNEP